MNELGALLFASLFIGLYLIPWIVAYMRGHRNTTAIAVLNIFAGWTFVGWIVALVWASTNSPA